MIFHERERERREHTRVQNEFCARKQVRVARVARDDWNFPLHRWLQGLKRGRVIPPLLPSYPYRAHPTTIQLGDLTAYPRSAPFEELGSFSSLLLPPFFSPSHSLSCPKMNPSHTVLASTEHRLWCFYPLFLVKYKSEGEGKRKREKKTRKRAERDFTMRSTCFDGCEFSPTEKKIKGWFVLIQRGAVGEEATHPNKNYVSTENWKRGWIYFLP